jgi:hypothetical protein
MTEYKENYYLIQFLKRGVALPIVLIVAKGLKCPQPTIQMTIKALKLKSENVYVKTV